MPGIPVKPFNPEAYKFLPPDELAIRGLATIGLLTAMEAHPDPKKYVKAANRAASKLSLLCHAIPGRRPKRAIVNCKEARVRYE